MNKLEDKKGELEKISKEFQESMQKFTTEIMEYITPAIKKATENIKNLHIEDSLELIQDEEIEDGE